MLIQFRAQRRVHPAEWYGTSSYFSPVALPLFALVCDLRRRPRHRAEKQRAERLERRKTLSLNRSGGGGAPRTNANFSLEKGITPGWLSFSFNYTFSGTNIPGTKRDPRPTLDLAQLPLQSAAIINWDTAVACFALKTPTNLTKEHHETPTFDLTTSPRHKSKLLSPLPKPRHISAQVPRCSRIRGRCEAGR